MSVIGITRKGGEHRNEKAIQAACATRTQAQPQEIAFIRVTPDDPPTKLGGFRFIVSTASLPTSPTVFRPFSSSCPIPVTIR